MKKVANMQNWIAELPVELMTEVLTHCTLRNLKKGEHLFSLGESSDECFQVKSGYLKVIAFNYSGRVMLHSHALAGDCIGDWELINDEPRNNSVIACESSCIYVLNSRRFWHFYNRYPDVAKAINKVMVRRLRFSNMLAEDACLLSLKQRVGRLLIRMAYSVGCVSLDGRAEIPNISQNDLGNIVGSPRQSVARELKKIEKEGCIEIGYGRLVINNIEDFSKQHDELLGAETLVPNSGRLCC